MKKVQVQASIASDVVGAPERIVFLPEGTHVISPQGVDSPVTITVTSDILATFQADLETRLSKNVRPYLDFDHKRGPASALPKSFDWEDGKGLILEVEWTKKGKGAIEGKDFSYFSPEFMADLELEVPVGLTSRGPLGGLVNEPAFEEIPRIAAKKAAPTKPENNNMEALVSAGILSSEESGKDNSVSLAAKRYAEAQTKASRVDAAEELAAKAQEELTETAEKLKAAQAELKEAADAKVETVIKAAITDGRLAETDEDSITFWRNSIANQGDPAIKALEALPAKNDHLKGKVIAHPSSGAPSENPILAAMNEAREKGEPTGDAISLASKNHPEAYAEYRKSLQA